MFQNCSVSIKKLDEQINSTIISAYSYDPGSMYKQFNSNFDSYLANAISLGRCIFKKIVSMGSCNVSSEDCDLFQCPYVITITNLEYNIDGILGLDHVQVILASVSTTKYNRPIGIKPIYISKLWIT